MKAKINGAIKTALSPRFVPDEIFEVPEIPRTLSGKKQELPIKKLLLGQPLEKVVNRDAMANPGCLDWYVAFARASSAGQDAPSALLTARFQAAGLRFTSTMPAATPHSASTSCSVSGSLQQHHAEHQREQRRQEGERRHLRGRIVPQQPHPGQVAGEGADHGLQASEPQA